jgi:hypothetical protein
MVNVAFHIIQKDSSISKAGFLGNSIRREAGGLYVK